MTIIQDGRGRGNSTGVNDDGRLEVASTSNSRITQVSSEHARAFELHPPRMNIATLSTDHRLVWMKNESEMYFYIDVIRWYWSGGSVNFNRPMINRTWLGDSAPTANQVTGKFGAGNTSHNLNLGSITTPDLDFRYWDGVGTGLTIVTPGQQINCGLLSQGLSQTNYGGSLILPPGSVLSLSAVAQYGETGDVVATVTGYFN